VTARTRTRTTRSRRLVTALVVVASMNLASVATEASAEAKSDAPTDAVLVWNEIAARSMIAAGITPLFDPLHESRLLAMTHIAIHDALNAIERHSRPYALDIGPFPSASTEAAVVTAAHDVLVPGLQELPADFSAGIPAGVAVVEDAATSALAAIPDGKAKRQGQAIGRAAAAVINAQRVNDGADSTFIDDDYEEGTAPGEFRFVENAPFAVAPKWGDVTPFVMSSGDQYRPRPPYDLTSRRYADDFNELKQLGDIHSTTRTAEQTEIAFFWFESSPLRWNRIARTVSRSAGLDLWENARLFALLNMVEADGYIGNWDSKYHYDRWRPETAVRLADIDGNPRTLADPTWVPLWGSSGATPEYDSGHTIEGAGSATVLAAVLGTDAVSFGACSYTFPDPASNCDGAAPIVREFDSFSSAAWENGVSRIYVGWHFRNAVEVGYRHGERIGRRAITRFLQPVG
jgi:hypothetical protein